MTIAAVVIAATTIFAGCEKDKNEKVKVTGVSVCPTSVMIIKGSETPLTAFVTPGDASDRSVRWTSDNMDVATVNENGVVTGNTLGIATITCRTNDGDYKAQTTVIVNPIRDGNDYATMLPGFYFGNLTMEAETVGTNNLITVKYNSENKVMLSINERFYVPQAGVEAPMKVDCIADVTKVESGYKVAGKTKINAVIKANITIDGVFNNNNLDLNILVEMPDKVNINFKGIGNMVIEPCAIID